MTTEHGDSPLVTLRKALLSPRKTPMPLPTTFPVTGCSPRIAPFPQQPQGQEVAQGAASRAAHSDKPPLE